MAKKRSSSNRFTLFSFLWRLVAVMALIMATYNPTEYSYVQWVSNTITGDVAFGASHFLVGVLLAVGWIILVVATKSSLGIVGSILGGIVLAALVWWLIDIGVLSVASVSAGTWVVLICLSALLTLGLSWSHMWRRLTGQVDIADDASD